MVAVYENRCMVAIYERSLYGAMYMRDHCMVPVYERSLYCGCILELIMWWLYRSDLNIK